MRRTRGANDQRVPAVVCQANSLLSYYNYFYIPRILSEGNNKGDLECSSAMYFRICNDIKELIMTESVLSNLNDDSPGSRLDYSWCWTCPVMPTVLIRENYWGRKSV